MSTQADFKQLVSHCKEYGYIFQSSEIYDGLGAVYDYGPFGVELKNNIKKYWWMAMVQMHDNIVGIDAAIFMHPKVWQASGHIANFNDPLIDNKDSKKRYRADVLLEDFQAKIQAKIDKEVGKAEKRFGESFDKAQFLETNPRVLANQGKIDDVNNRLKAGLEANDLEAIKQIIVDYEIACPESGSRNWTDVRQFNLMFSTQMGASTEGADTIYLRPETAQGIFVNYLNVQKTARMKLPFGIAQIGKSFRNEIVARQFIFRTREFEQMEMQFFVQPGTQKKWYEYWKEARMKWHLAAGFPEVNLTFHDHLKPAHYADDAVDIEYKFPFGVKEMEGIHSRTDFDLNQHQEHSGKKLQYFDPETKESYVPYVVETAIGLDRMCLAVISNALMTEEVENAKGEKTERVVMKINPALAPIKVAVLPLINKDGLPEKAREIYNTLRFDCNAHYEEKDTIGKRYRRMDAIGTPYCITIDHDSLNDNMVTIRERDTMAQERISIDDVAKVVGEKTSMKNLFV